MSKNETDALRRKIKYLAAREGQLKKFELASMILPEAEVSEIQKLVDASKSSHGQDIFALAAMKKGGVTSAMDFTLSLVPSTASH